MLSKNIFTRLTIRIFSRYYWLVFTFSFLCIVEKNFFNWKVFLYILCSLNNKILFLAVGLCEYACISFSLCINVYYQHDSTTNCYRMSKFGILMNYYITFLFNIFMLLYLMESFNEYRIKCLHKRTQKESIIHYSL